MKDLFLYYLYYSFNYLKALYDAGWENFFDWRDACFYSFAIIFIILERVVPVRKQTFWRKDFLQDIGFRSFDVIMDILLGSFANLVKTFTAIFVLKTVVGVAFGLFSNEPYYYQQIFPVKIENKFLMFSLIIMSQDLLYYLAHFMVHRFSLFRPFHATHHGIEKLDWLSGFRGDFIEMIIMGLLTNLTFVFIDVTAKDLVYLVFFQTLFEFYIHANVRFPNNVITRWINTTRAHWWHHVKKPEFKYGQNFGGYTLIWDRLFGTYYVGSDYPQELGLPDQAQYPQSFIPRLIYPYRVFFKNLLKLLPK